jgi:hypothetical protein
MAYTSALEPWRYCDICRTEDTQPFSVERAYKAHLNTQKHLMKLKRPPPAFPCEVCNTTFSRPDGVTRHQKLPGQCPGHRATTELPLKSSKKHPLNVDLDEAPQKHRKIDNQENLGVYIAPHPAPITIKQMVGKSGTTAKSSDFLSLLPSSSSIQEQNVFHDCKGTNDVSEHRPRQQNFLAGHEIPHARLEPAHKGFQKTGPWFSGPYNKGKGFLDILEDISTANSGQSIDCFGEDSDKKMRVAADGFSTHSAFNIIPRRTVQINPEKAEDHAVNLLSVAMSSASIKDATSQTAISQPGTLSSMSSIYGSKSLYRANSLGSSQHTKSSLPEMQAFDATIDWKPPQNLAEVSEVVEPHSLETNWEEVLEIAMIEDIWKVPNLQSDHRKGLDINHISSRSNGETPLMAAIRCNYFVVWELFTESVALRTWPLLSARDVNGNTAIELAAANGTELIFAQLLERIITIFCCDCDDLVRSRSVCGRIAHSANFECSGLMLEEGPCRYPFKAYCQWGDKLLRPDWLNADTLQEIDELMRFRIRRIDGLHKVRVECELQYLNLLAWDLAFGTYRGELVNGFSLADRRDHLRDRSINSGSDINSLAGNVTSVPHRAGRRIE